MKNSNAKKKKYIYTPDIGKSNHSIYLPLTQI